MSKGFTDNFAFNPLGFSGKAWREETRYIQTDVAGGEAPGILPNLSIYAINKSGITIPEGGIGLLVVSGAEDANPQVGHLHAASGATGATNLVVVAETAVANNAEGWFAYRGYCNALVESTIDIADGDNLGINGGAQTTSPRSLKKVSAYGKNVVGKACAARTANNEGVIRVVLIGREIDLS